MRELQVNRRRRKLETNRHYFLVGTFVLGTVLFALIFTVWLTSANSGDIAKYRIRFAESVSGLPVGGLVKYRGVDVGTVESIQIDRRDTRLISVIIAVKKDTPIKYGTEAILKLQGITGVVYIELSGGYDNAKEMPKETNEDDIPEIVAKSSPISAIVDRLPEVMDRLTVTVEQINKIFNDDNVEAMSSIIQDASATAANLNEMTTSYKASVNETVGNLNRSSQQLDLLMRDFRKTSRNVSGLAEGLNEDPSRLVFPAPPKGVPAP